MVGNNRKISTNSQACIIEDGDQSEEEYGTNDPLVRTPNIFGGLINDLKRRYSFYWSDFTDGFDLQVLAATIYIYMASLTGGIAFGGLLGEKTNKLIGVSEALMFSSISGIIFALFAGMPLIVICVTGPVLLFDEALYGFCMEKEINFLSWRIWIGIWLMIIALVVSMFQGSVLVKYFTKFTRDIYTALIGILYIYEAIRKLYKVFKAHPLRSIEYYCSNFTNNDNVEHLTREEPNTALLSGCLMIVTFCITYNLRQLKHSQFFPRPVRTFLADFGVSIALLIMVTTDYFIEDVFTDKLDVPDGLQVTDPSQRSWIINPLPKDTPLWIPFAAGIPALLLYLLLFMSTHICELLMMEKTNEKGAGVHWDIVLICACNCIGSFFGTPWICTSTVRSISHATSLTYTTNTAALKIGSSLTFIKTTAIKDQRVSCLLVSILLGFSVLLSPVLKFIPYPVLFGMFLFMGITSLEGTQFFHRLCLILVPKKFHPHVTYVTRVQTWKMHLFTIMQTIGLGILWAIKSSSVALVFPLFVVGMVPLRLSLAYFYTSEELEAIDGKSAGKNTKKSEQPTIDALTRRSLILSLPLTTDLKMDLKSWMPHFLQDQDQNQD